MNNLVSKSGTFICSTAVALAMAGAVHSHDGPSEALGKVHENIVIRGAKVFDGCTPELEAADVLISGNLITQIEPNLDAPADALVIEADGQVLMPGLIDAHWHGVIATATVARLMGSGEGYWNLIAAKAQRDVLYRGFTTIRDAGGPMFDIARATDEGLIVGPRVYPSGPQLTQTSGHGDFRSTNDVPAEHGHLHPFERAGMFYVADGVPEVLKRAREVLMGGATQVKVHGGGGVTSAYDPIHTVQYTLEEIRAAVTVAEGWGTYVLTHTISDESVNHAMDAGVKSIEHGHLVTRETLQRMADEDVWLSIQPFLDDEDAPTLPSADSRAKYARVTEGTDFVYPTAKELGVKIAFGTDALFDENLAARQGAQLVKLKKWFTPFEALKMATCDNAELLKMSGELNPYQEGALGVVEVGAYADLILVDGNPLENLDLVGDPAENFDLIMKDGVIYKLSLD
ncbi:amidohydrolase family protein [Leisingera aquaemixtae]|uniref:metal-dependent hydrolase family protein n=1 Tax=Leisingera aquaemixtae TaxID=1396826 RepID=UPI001C97C8E8|nr:amidohydrolase family protein [Leisingera aquaemixtae]MBY6066903.1 amidohydrolase family protein [Leisingera aquaemixtae]